MLVLDPYRIQHVERHQLGRMRPDETCNARWLRRSVAHHNAVESRSLAIHDDNLGLENGAGWERRQEAELRVMRCHVSPAASQHPIAGLGDVTLRRTPSHFSSHEYRSSSIGTLASRGCIGSMKGGNSMCTIRWYYNVEPSTSGRSLASPLNLSGTTLERFSLNFFFPSSTAGAF
jgi:hypothetical protein